MATIQASGTVRVCQHPNMTCKMEVVETPTDHTAVVRYSDHHCPDCGERNPTWHIIGPNQRVHEFAGVNLSSKLPELETIANKRQPAAPAAKKEPPPPPDPSKGLAGTEMLQLTAELGIVSPPACGCKGMAATMDRLGVEECRVRITDLRLSIAANWAAWGWADKMKAVTAAAWKGAGLGINPTDPVRDLLEIALERADAKRKQGE